MLQDSELRCYNALFRYLSHFTVVIPCESAPPSAEREKKRGTRAPPPKSGGACDPDSGTELHTAIRPHAGSLSSSFIPAGRLGRAPRRGAERNGERYWCWHLLSLTANRSRLVLAVQGPLRRVPRHGRLRADPGDALFTRGKGGTDHQ